MWSLNISLVLGAFSVAYGVLPRLPNPSHATSIHSSSQIQFKANAGDAHPTAGDDIVREIADLEANPNEHLTKSKFGSKTSSSSGGSSKEDKIHSWGIAAAFAILLILLLLLTFMCLFKSARSTETE